MSGGGISTSSPAAIRPGRPLLGGGILSRRPRGRRRFLKALPSSEPQPGASACWPDLLPALGFGSAVAALGIGSAAAALGFGGGGRLGWPASEEEAGEWFLLSSPTPFNLCVFLRCAAVSFVDGSLRRDGFLSAGRVAAAAADVDPTADVAYQRVCVGAEDAGVIALDWPEHLDLAGEQSLDTAVLIVPGTPEGSRFREVQAFVREAVGHGLFPVVMNPRGCAGSPVTTPRLFSAADSDDVDAAVRFITKTRPRTTLMAIGWGYGANMLTKYLAEVGEKTPLTAAVCIDNPFDLNEAAKSSAMDEKITLGLVEILRANKEIFRGKNKGFDVVKALSARSLRDFEASISMVSYGFESVEEFYLQTSTRDVIQNVKIPLLFLQNREGSPDSICPVPRSTIEDNPFTSLILCSCSTFFPKNQIIARNWRRNLAMEWFCAVELAILKGRHPLLKEGVDIAVTPRESLPIKTKSLKEEVADGDKIPKSSDLENSSQNPAWEIDHRFQGNFGGLQRAEADHLSNIVEILDCSLVGGSEESEDSATDHEKGQILGAANVILNMLDLTMPGTLDAEQKNKILTATDQGETFMKALNEAVPEDVRGKLNSAVSGIIQAQGSKIDVNILKRIGSDPCSNSGYRPKIHEDVNNASSDHELLQDNSSVSFSSALPQDIEDSEVSMSKSEVEASSKPSHEGTESPHDSINDGLQGIDNYKIQQNKVPEDSNDVSSVSCSSNFTGSIEDSEASTPQAEIGVNRKPEEAETENSVNTINDKLIQKENHQVKEKKVPEESNDVEKINPTEGKENLADSSSVEGENLLKEGTNVPVSDSGNARRSNPQQFNPPPTISVSKALDALTGFDDSTQMAVSSVFGVIENMIDQLEGEGLSMDVGQKSDDTAVIDISVPSTNNPETDSGAETIETLEDNSKNDSDESENLGYDELLKAHDMKRVPLDFNAKPYLMPLKVSNLKSSDPEPTMDLFLDPDEGQWKVLDHKESNGYSQDFEDHDNDESIGSTHEKIYNDIDGSNDKNGDLSLEGSNEVKIESLQIGGSRISQTSSTQTGTVVAGAVTMALGASALLAHHKENEANISKSNGDLLSGQLDQLPSSHDAVEDKPQSNLVSSLAEKAMSVAAPVVPTKEDGGVDHERLVASLAELGQKGGILRLIGKAALLWGGMRGAMSLTDKLISFLRIAERPLLQRLLAFFGMALIMWSPVVVPLLPTIVESWRSTSSRGVAEYACIWGLYVAILILLVLWGRRIRDYDDPLQRYGLDLASPKVRLFLKGFFGGVALVFYAHSISALLGFASSVRPPLLSSPPVSAAVLIRSYGWAFIKTLQTVASAACAATVEELLFRSWLVEEMAADLGHVRAIVISGLVFSLLQGSVQSVPGFLLLSLALSGAKQEARGSLFLPIGIRAGIITVNSAVQIGGFLRYRPDTPAWLAGPHPWRPFDGAAGLAVCLLMAIYLRPRGLPQSDPGT
ncbi:alpha/beta-Hydrolases superfamily protein [Wolffia australiana]